MDRQLRGPLPRVLTAARGGPPAFAGLNAANRYAILFRVQTARKPETREKRIRQFVEMLERGEKLYP